MRLDGSGSTLNGFESLEVPLLLRLGGFRSVLHDFSLLWVTLDGFRLGLDRFRSTLDGFRSTEFGVTHPKGGPETIQTSPDRLDVFGWLCVHFKWV